MAKPGDEPRAAILEAARRLLADEGPRALTVRRIAADAGASTMTVYSRFGGKDGVVDALYQEGFALLASCMSRSRATDDPVSDLRRCAAAYRRFALDNPTYYAVMFDRVVVDFVPTDEALTKAAATLDMLAQRVQRAIDAGALRGPSADALAADMWATNHGLVSLELHGVGPPSIDWARRHTETIDALLRGLAPSPAPSGPAAVRRPRSASSRAPSAARR